MSRYFKKCNGRGPSLRSGRPRDSVSKLAGILRGIKQYWFVALPAIMLNVGFTLDHVIAKNHENSFRVLVSEVTRDAFESSAGQDGETLSDSLEAHWITTNQDGNLVGRVSAIEPTASLTVPIEKLDVALLKRGEKIHLASTDSDGKFVLENVKTGIYTLIASGRNGFLAYGVHVLPKLEPFEDLDKNTMYFPKEQMQALKQAYYVSHFNVPQDSVVVDNLQIDAAAVPPEFTTLQRISQSYLPLATAFTLDRDQDDATSTEKATDIRSGYKHPLTDDGSFEGRIQPIATVDGQDAKLSEINVFLIQDDIEAARVSVEENGQFKIENVDPGVYSLVAAGKNGFAALSLELQSASAELKNASKRKPQASYVSVRASEPENADEFVLAIVTDPQDLEAIKQEINRVVNLRQQMLVQPNGANQFADQGIIYDGAFPPGTVNGFPDGGVIAGGPTGPVSGGSTVVYGRRGGVAALIALSLGITALATNDSGSDPPPQSPAAPVDNSNPNNSIPPPTAPNPPPVENVDSMEPSENQPPPQDPPPEGQNMTDSTTDNSDVTAQ